MSALRDFLSENGRKAIFEARRLSPLTRAMPDFIVIGAQKSGTSSMFFYLRQHQQVVRPMFKEIYYFDRNYARGLSWYGCNFPAQTTLDRLNDRRGHRHLTFEATATYIFDADVPRRIARDIKTRKFIALLRNPTDRAISAYWHARRLGLETRSLEAALADEMAWHDAQQAVDAGRRAEPAGPPPYLAYLRRGIYHEAVANWQRSFPADNLLVIQSETMFADPAATMARVFRFLDLPPIEAMDFEPKNVGDYAESDPAARRFLNDFYRPHNDKLGALTGNSFTW